MRQPFVCKIAYPVEESIPERSFYAYGYLIPVSDMDEVEAVVLTPSGERIPGHRLPSFPPYDWFFQFFGLPVNQSLKLVVAARDAIGRTSRDVTHVILSPPVGQITITISAPPAFPTPSFVVAPSPFSTWGFISNTAQVGNMAANIAVGGFNPIDGVAVPATPPFHWRFNFQIPIDFKNHTGTLNVTCPNSNNPTRSLTFT